MNYSPPRIPFFVDTDVSGKGRHGLQTKSGTYCGFLPTFGKPVARLLHDPGHRKQRQKGYFTHRCRCVVTPVTTWASSRRRICLFSRAHPHQWRDDFQAPTQFVHITTCKSFHWTLFLNSRIIINFSQFMQKSIFEAICSGGRRLISSVSIMAKRLNRDFRSSK